MSGVALVGYGAAHAHADGPQREMWTEDPTPRGGDTTLVRRPIGVLGGLQALCATIQTMGSEHSLLDALELPPAVAARVDRRQFESLDYPTAAKIRRTAGELEVHLIVYKRACPPLAPDAHLCRTIEPAQLDAVALTQLAALECELDGIVVAYRRPLRLRRDVLRCMESNDIPHAARHSNGG